MEIELWQGYEGFAKTENLYLIKYDGENLAYFRSEERLWEDTFLPYYAEWGGLELEKLSLHWCGPVLNVLGAKK